MSKEEINYDIIHDVIGRISNELNKQLENLIIEGLKRKGFEFKHRIELEAFVKERCRYEDNVDLKEKFYYEDNRRKGRDWTIELKKNKYIIFPSTNKYIVINHQKKLLNFVQTITYEGI